MFYTNQKKRTLLFCTSIFYREKLLSSVCVRLISPSKQTYLWCENLPRKQVTAAILLLVPNDFRFLGFSFIFPTSNEGQCFFIDRSTNMYYASWPISAPAQSQNTFALSVKNFLAVNCRCDSS